MARNKTPVAEQYNAPFPSALRILMKERGKTQENIAKAVEKTRQTISQYVNGVSEPGYDVLVKIADYFDVSIDYLLGRTKDPCRSPCAVDALGISPDIVNWIMSLKNDPTVDSSIVNKIFENPSFHCLVYDLHDYSNAVKAEKIYDNIFLDFFPDLNDEDAPEYVHREFNDEIKRIVESNQYGKTVSALLLAHSQIWDATSERTLGKILVGSDGFAIREVYDLKATRRLKNVLDLITAVAYTEPINERSTLYKEIYSGVT